MFRRALLQTARHLRVSAYESTLLRNSAIRRYPSPTVTSALLAFAGRRAYSTEPGKEEGDKAREIEAEASQNEKQTPKSADQLQSMVVEMNKCKSELEAKVKEVADLKVNSTL